MLVKCRLETCGIRYREVEQQILGCIGIIIKIELQAVVECGEVETKVQRTGLLPFQILVGDVGCSGSSLFVFAISGIISSELSHIGVVADTVVTRRTIRYAEFQQINPVHILHEILLVDFPSGRE